MAVPILRSWQLTVDVVIGNDVLQLLLSDLPIDVHISIHQQDCHVELGWSKSERPETVIEQESLVKSRNKRASHNVTLLKIMKEGFSCFYQEVRQLSLWVCMSAVIKLTERLDSP